MTDNDSPSPDNPKPPELSLLEQADTFEVEEGCCEFVSFEYYTDENMYWALYRYDSESPSIAVVSAVAAVSGEDPLDMEPLYSTIDPDAFNSLVTAQGATRDNLQVTFEFQGYEVLVSDTGSIKVQLPQSK